MTAAPALAPRGGWDDRWAHEELPAVEAVAELGGAARPADLELLSLVDPDDLPDHGARLDYVAALDRVIALAASMRAVALVAVAGGRASGAYLEEVQLEHEVALARRTSRYAAGRALEQARCLATVFPGFADALRRGQIGEGHVAVLVERTRAVQGDDVLAAIEARVLPKALRMTPGELGREVAKAVAVLDPDAAGRHRRARAGRRVWTRPCEDGLGFLGLVHDQATVAAIAATLDADAARLRAEHGAAPDAGPGATLDDASLDDATLDAGRADALAARVLGTLGPDGTVSFERTPVPVTLDLVMDLDTLRAERDALALLDGSPVPAPIARELAAGATAWRRMVTDPVTGHLLDAGTRTYLPGPLRRYVLARDGGCRAPGCTTRAPSRLQLDHAIPFPAGRSSAANTGALCTTCHQLKTDRRAHIAASQADGSCTWTTGWGQHVTIPARPFLDDPP